MARAHKLISEQDDLPRKKLLTRNEFIAMLGVSRMTQYRLEKRGLPVVSVRTATRPLVRIDADAALLWISASYIGSSGARKRGRPRNVASKTFNI